MEKADKTFKRESHLRDYLIVIRNRKWLIISAVIVVLASTFLYLRWEEQQPDLYQAQASVMIEPRFSQDTIFSRLLGSAGLDLGTQIEVIKTTPVLATVVKKLGLTTAEEGTLEFSMVVKNLRKSIKISPIKDTSMITITAVHTIPEKAQAIANAVAQAYIDQDRLIRLRAGQDSVRWLSAQLADLKAKLENAESAFQNFKAREGMITLDDKRSEELGELSRFNTTYLSIRGRILEIEAIISRLESEGSSDMDIPVALLDSPILQKLGSELSQLQLELTDKRRIFKDTYPEIVKLKTRIQQIKKEILTELKRQRSFLQAQERAFLTEQELKRKEALKLNKKELEYLALEREVKTNQELYNTLLAKITELRLTENVDMSNIRIVEPAELPVIPMGIKDPVLILILGGFLGLFLGIGFAFFFEYMENTISTPDDVTQLLGLPVLGIIPRIAKIKKATPIVIVRGNSKSASAEAYRSLRTNLLFSGLGNPMKTVVITSAEPKEGKSLTSVNLGVALAQAGKKVLLVDADLRRPTLHRVFGLSRHNGLTAVLLGESSLDDAIVKPDIPNLSLLPAGVSPDGHSELLGSTKMKELINYIRGQYDIVLFDSAPVLGMADTVVLMAETDGALIVVHAGKTTRKALKVAIAQLEQLNIKICGVVLNNVNVKRDKHYDYYYYYYSYEDEEKNKSRG